MIPVRHIGDLNVGHELHVEIGEALADASRTISRDAGLDVITEDRYVSRTAICGGRRRYIDVNQSSDDGTAMDNSQTRSALRALTTYMQKYILAASLAIYR